jgi:hypothetical protein
MYTDIMTGKLVWITTLFVVIEVLAVDTLDARHNSTAHFVRRSSRRRSFGVSDQETTSVSPSKKSVSRMVARCSPHSVRQNGSPPAIKYQSTVHRTDPSPKLQNGVVVPFKECFLPATLGRAKEVVFVEPSTDGYEYWRCGMVSARLASYKKCLCGAQAPSIPDCSLGRNGRNYACRPHSFCWPQKICYSFLS